MLIGITNAILKYPYQVIMVNNILRRERPSHCIIIPLIAELFHFRVFVYLPAYTINRISRKLLGGFKINFMGWDVMKRARNNLILGKIGIPL